MRFADLRAMPCTSHALESALARSFLNILRWAAASGALCAGCDARETGESELVPFASQPGLAPTVFTGGLLVPSCTGSDWQPLRGFNPKERWDYVSYRTSSADAPSGQGRVLQEIGGACAGSVDRGACLEELDVASRGQTNEFLLATTGDEVHVLRGAGALALFGEIDRADEALWLARAIDSSLDPCAPPVELTRLDDGAIRIEAFIPNAGSPCPYGSLSGSANSTRFVRYRVARNGTAVREYSSDSGLGCAVPGRRPAGLCAEPARVSDEALGSLLAREAHAEAASVWAFVQLERELSVHAAPSELRLGARRARYEEARHARAMAGLARRFGGRPALPRVAAQPIRSLSEIALDNAAEGCVRESYAALRVAYQMRHAQDRAGARALAQLADDELRHAAWSWQLARWAEPRLSVLERRRARAARAAALHALSGEVDHAYSADAQRVLGYPDRSAALQLVRGLRSLANDLTV